MKSKFTQKNIISKYLSRSPGDLLRIKIGEKMVIFKRFIGDIIRTKYKVFYQVTLNIDLK